MSEKKKIDAEDFGKIQALRDAVNAAIYRLGELEVEKGRILDQMYANRKALDEEVQVLKKKHGIKDGSNWRIDPEGCIIEEG